MAKPSAIILSSGDLRSLVASALVAAEQHPPRLIVLWMADGRPAQSARKDHAHRQAEHVGADRVIDLTLPHPPPSASRQAEWSTGTPRPALARAQLLVTAVAHAVELNAQSVIWPAQYDGDFAKIARATEQVELVSHLAGMDHADAPPILTPLVELTDRQLIELGGQLDVPWRIAWSCQVQDATPCRACAGCQRRYAAFTAAGADDPTDNRGQGSGARSQASAVAP